MKYQLIKPFLFLLAFVLVFGLACSVLAPSTPVAQPAIPVAESPVPPPPATAVPVEVVSTTAAAAEPTQPPAPPANSRFFTEEFDGDLSNWEYFHFGKDGSDYDVSTDDGLLVFEIKDEDTYVFNIYTAEKYDDVRIDTEANNRGYNYNNVGLICRFDEDDGWYEFNISNDGLYEIWAFDILGDTGYNLIANGGAQNIKTGKETNNYGIVCRGKTLTLYVNGREINSIEENKYGFKRGYTGVSVSAENVIPIKVEFEWVKISEP